MQEDWIVGKWTGPKRWEFAGVYSTEALAVGACRSNRYFVAPAVIDEELPDEETTWPGAYYPKAAARA